MARAPSAHRKAEYTTATDFRHSAIEQRYLQEESIHELLGADPADSDRRFTPETM
jgi:hypothetical protein